jgi:hypothetical protein
VRLVTSGFGGYCCKSRKSNGTKNSAKVDFLTALPQQSPVAAIRWSVVAAPFAGGVHSRVGSWRASPAPREGMRKGGALDRMLVATSE